VFLDRIVAAAAHAQVDHVRVFGIVLAHEVGHLVLPEWSHAEVGIMSAHLVPRSFGAKRFTEAQAETIRRMIAGL
jgi:hypothetical protein